MKTSKKISFCFALCMAVSCNSRKNYAILQPNAMKVIFVDSHNNVKLSSLNLETNSLNYEVYGNMKVIENTVNTYKGSFYLEAANKWFPLDSVILNEDSLLVGDYTFLRWHKYLKKVRNRKLNYYGVKF